jgi:ABC-type phosphate/phosphonate transport system substrate-binding protein
MYNLTQAIAADWHAWLKLLEEKLAALPASIRVVSEYAPFGPQGSYGPDLDTFWTNDRLLLSQTCGYPLTHALAGKVQLVATPEFDAPGCSGPNYSSVFIVRADDRAGRGASALASYRGRRAALNNVDSNSGMNVFRHAVAPLAAGRRFFSSVVTTGSHHASMQAVADGTADIASIDCVTFAFAQEALQDLTRRLHVIGYSASSCGLPLIASKKLDAGVLENLQNALDASIYTQPALMRRLKIRSFARVQLADYDRITAIEREAAALGYPTLA